MSTTDRPSYARCIVTGAATMAAFSVIPLATADAGVRDSLSRKRTTPVVIHEDDPRWDCRTMGNLDCGVVTNGVRYIVTFDAHGMPVSVKVMAR